jgi:glycosyltransferase involved in cell wall biosynthesis
MEKTVNTASFAIVGPYPPPNGGVANHLLRLSALLDQRGIAYRIYNIASDRADGNRVVSVAAGRLRWLVWYALFGKETSVYFMTRRLGAWLLAAAMARFRGKQVMIRLQNNKEVCDWCEHSPLKKWLAGLALRNVTGVVCVSRGLAESVAGPLRVPSERVFHFPGFLPPAPENLDKSAINDSVWEFVERHEPIVSANGAVECHNGQDRYGLDHLVELVARLKPEYPNVGVVFSFWKFDPQDQPELDRLKEVAKVRGVLDQVCFNTQSAPFVPILAESDLFVRPVTSDGDANSIREAQALGVPVVASDVVERPRGTVLFQTRNLDDFVEKVRIALKDCDRSTEKKRVPVLSEEDMERVGRYLNLVQRFASGNLPKK